MALTESTMMALGTKAPDFKLLDTVSKKHYTLQELKSEKATVIMFICNHCPFVIHLNKKIVEVANAYQAKGISFIAISSNSIESHPQDGPDYMTVHAKEQGYPFPYLFDATQEVARAYSAACTPDFFIFDKDLLCVYRGRFDETRPNVGSPTGKDLTLALDALLIGDEVSILQRPSMGCNIKWK